MSGYYENKLAASRLKQCYDLARPRIEQYLRSELDYVLQHVQTGQSVLDLGCGYGRILDALAKSTTDVVGIDTSLASLKLARNQFANTEAISLLNMDAAHLGFVDNCFDLTLCIQNGLSAFSTEPSQLIDEIYRATKPGGTALLSTYSDKFWSERLRWFELQANAGLLGEIDYERSNDGVIVCHDGFRATTFTKTQLRSLTSHLNAQIEIVEIDCSSLFCKIVLRG